MERKGRSDGKTLRASWPPPHGGGPGTFLPCVVSLARSHLSEDQRPVLEERAALWQHRQPGGPAFGGGTRGIWARGAL